MEKTPVKGVDGPTDSSYNLINQLGKGPRYSMHMPGHCGNNEVTPILNQFLKENGGNAIEGTTDEVFGTLGNYYPPSGVMKNSLDQAAKLYGTKCTYYGINGSTGNLISATRCLGGNK
jgi:arginine/lysine/ornithine decarboxylase